MAWGQLWPGGQGGPGSFPSISGRREHRFWRGLGKWGLHPLWAAPQIPRGLVLGRRGSCGGAQGGRRRPKPPRVFQLPRRRCWPTAWSCSPSTTRGPRRETGPPPPLGDTKTTSRRPEPAAWSRGPGAKPQFLPLAPALPVLLVPPELAVPAVAPGGAAAALPPCRSTEGSRGRASPRPRPRPAAPRTRCRVCTHQSQIQAPPWGDGKTPQPRVTRPAAPGASGVGPAAWGAPAWCQEWAL